MAVDMIARGMAAGAAKEAQQNSLPPVSSTDNGDVLGVVNGAWNKMAAPGGLPTVTSADNGKVLAVENGSWAAADKSPLIVTYTITGEDMPFPLSYSHTLAQIAAAQAAGREVLGTLTRDGVPGTLAPIVRMAQNGIMVYAGVLYNYGVGLVQVVHDALGEPETAVLYVIPLSTYSMNFDSSTGTLDIND